MLSDLQDLISLDVLSAKRWFSKESVWKSLIAIAFSIVMLGVGFLIYYFSRFYFNYLSDFETFGEMTISYVLRATILIIAWVGILSSFISSLTLLLTPSKHIDNLVTLPINPLHIIIWQIIKTFFLNLSIFLITIFPLALAYFSNKNIGVFESILRSLSVLFILSAFVESLGSIFAFLLASRLKLKEGSIFILGAVLIFVLGTVFVYKIIFPPSLATFENIKIESFASEYSNLPLIKSCYVAKTFAGILENGWGSAFSSISLVTIFLLFISILIQKRLFISNWQQVRLDLYRPKPKVITTKTTSLNLVKKDLFSIIRSPKELGYAIFLFLMLIIFLGLFARGIEVNRIPSRFAGSAMVFSWFWLIFYSGTFIIRLIFPLMSRENRTRWWLFTLPIKPSRLVESKSFVGFILSIPLLFVGILEWSLSPLEAPNLFLLASGFLVIIWLSQVLTFIGMIKPDYSQGDDPEKVSTGFAGLIALVIVILSGIALSYLINLSSQGIITLSDSLVILFFGSLITAIPLFLTAVKFTQNHNVEV